MHGVVDCPRPVSGDEAFDEIVYVKTPLLKRILRLKKGRGMSVAQAIRRIRSQVPSSILRAKSTQIIDNKGSLDKLKKKATVLFDKILEKHNEI